MKWKNSPKLTTADHFLSFGMLPLTLKLKVLVQYKVKIYSLFPNTQSRILEKHQKVKMKNIIETKVKTRLASQAANVQKMYFNCINVSGDQMFRGSTKR